MNSSQLFSVDLHGDILTDVFMRRHKRGERQVLLNHHLTPLRQGGVAIQVMAVYITSDYLPDSALRHAMRMIGGLYEEVAETPEHFLIVHTTADLDRAIDENKIALILSFEGADPIDRDSFLLRLFYRLGLHMVGLTWNRANQFAQGAAEDTGAGMSVVGRELLQTMEHLGIMLDLSHLSPSSFWSALENFKGPILASHSNARAVTDHPRNLTDDQIKAIGARHGLIGLNFIPRFVGKGDLLRGLVRHADHIRNLIAVEHLALGPDFIDYLPDIGESSKQRLLGPGDPESQAGAKMPDVTLLPALWQAFLDSGWSTNDTAAVFGGNALRYLRETLPPG